MIDRQTWITFVAAAVIAALCHGSFKLGERRAREVIKASAASSALSREEVEKNLYDCYHSLMKWNAQLLQEVSDLHADVDRLQKENSSLRKIDRQSP